MHPTPLPIVPQLSDDPLSRYALEMLRMRPAVSPLDDVLNDVLKEQEDLAARENIPIIGPLEGAIIQVLVRLRRPPARHVLDIGGAIGYSALWLARSLPPENQVISIEMDPQRAEKARYFIEKAKFQDRVCIVVGNVLELLSNIDTQFDVIFQDVIKHVYFGADSSLAVKLLDQCLACLAEGGLLLSDNAFCMGEVLHPSSEQMPKQVAGIKAYNLKVATHQHLESVIIPVRDGLWVSYKHSNPGP